MYRIYLQNAPFLFSGVFKVLCMVIDKRTQKKIQISSKDTNKMMDEHISKHQREKRYGGLLDEPQEGEFWPPRYRNNLMASLDDAQ
jgi:hypothetical protein